MCVAAYAVLFTGVGLSLTAAAAIRWGLIALSVAALAYLAYRCARRMTTAVRRRARILRTGVGF
jgi:hypothetical protein